MAFTISLTCSVTWGSCTKSQMDKIVNGQNPELDKIPNEDMQFCRQINYLYLSVLICQQWVHYQSWLFLFLKLVRFRILSVRDFVHSGFCPIRDFFHGFCLNRDFVHSRFCPIRDFVHSGFCPIRDFFSGILSNSGFCPYWIWSNSGFCTFGILSNSGFGISFFGILPVNGNEGLAWLRASSAVNFFTWGFAMVLIVLVSERHILNWERYRED